MAPLSMGSPPVPGLNAQLIAEFIGTFVLTLTVGCNVLLRSSVWGGLSVACALVVSTYGLAGISGAHFNPAVTVALTVSRHMGGHGILPKTASMYVVVQIFAGIAGAVCYTMLCHGEFDLGTAPGFGGGQACLVEFLYAFMLCFVVLSMPLAAQDGPNDFFGLAVGFVMVAGLYGAGAISGGYFNPAVAIGIDVASDREGFGWCIGLSMCQLLGGAASAAVFKVVRNEDFGGLRRGMVPELTSEFVGTYLVVVTYGLNVMGKSPAGPFSVAAALMCMMYALSGVSGGNFNPAVTLAVFMSGRCQRGTSRKTPGQMLCSMSVQCLAGVFGALTYSLIYLGGSFRLGPGAAGAWGWDAVVMAEFIFSFLLCYVYLAVTLSEATASTAMYGLAVGVCMAVGGVAAAKVSGGVINPAIAVGIAAANRFHDYGLFAVPVYFLAQLLGGAAASSVFKVTHKVDMETKVEY